MPDTLAGERQGTTQQLEQIFREFQEKHDLCLGDSKKRQRKGVIHTNGGEPNLDSAAAAGPETEGTATSTQRLQLALVLYLERLLIL